MFRNYIKTALRILKRYTSYSVISIAGLSVGFTCAALLMLFLVNEMRYDRFHEKADSIYRISTVRSEGGEQMHDADSPPPLAELIRHDFPEVEEAVRIKPIGERALRYDEQAYWGDGFYAEPQFFRIFSFRSYAGSMETALAAPGSVILTRPMAERIFRQQDPMGESIVIDNEVYEVRGLIEAVPENSHLQFDYLVSWSSFEKRVTDSGENPEFLESWYYGTSHTYILSGQMENRSSFESRLSETVNSRIEGVDFGLDFILQPLTEIYLYSNTGYEIGPTGNLTLLWVLGFLVVVILVIVSFNFINLATAFMSYRLKEIGVRKTLGAMPADFKQQFLGETLLICLFAMAISVVLVEMMLPYFTSLTGTTFGLHYLDPEFAIGYLLLTLLIGVLAGVFPAFHTARQDPFNNAHSQKSSGWPRKIMVASQFGIAAILLTGSLGINSQLSYMAEKDLGFEAEGVMVIRNRDPRAFARNFDAFKQELLSRPGIQNVTASTGRGASGGISGSLDAGTGGVDMEWMGVDPEFIDLFDILVKEGRNFSGNFATDSRQAFIINETAAREMELSSPVGSEVTMSPLRRTGEIVGVVEDFHFSSLRERIQPMVMVMMSKSAASFISVKIASGMNQQALAHIEKVWEQFADGQPLDYSFMSQLVEQQYSRERKYFSMFNIASWLAVMLSCVGLFGLVVFMISNRIKEIGIRKILGAEISSLILLLSRDYVRLAATGIAVAVPLVYYGLDQWLQQFAYKADMGAGIFLVSAGVILSVVLLVISGKTIKAAMTAPVESLRSE